MASHNSVERSIDLEQSCPRPTRGARRVVVQVLSLQHVILKAAAMTGLVITIILSASGLAAAFAPDKPVESYAGEFIKGLIYKGMAVFQDPQLTTAERDRRFTQLIEQNLDIQKIARFTLGRYWISATEKERQDFINVLPGYLGQAFAGRISQFAGALVEVVRASRVNDETHVVTRIYFMGPRPSSASTSEFELGWLVGQTVSGFRVEDLDIEGTSLELTERTDLTSLIERTGATVTGAVNNMRQTLKGSADE
jgi:phospholipid transport system substrate-binding protein